MCSAHMNRISVIVRSDQSVHGVFLVYREFRENFGDGASSLGDLRQGCSGRFYIFFYLAACHSQVRRSGVSLTFE